jgi:hypothetical protein
LLAKLTDKEVGQVVCDLLGSALLDRYAVSRCNRAQLGDIADHIAFRFAVGCGFEDKSHIPAMVRVRCRSGRDGADKITGLHGLHGCPTDARLPVFGQPARAHPADLAA